MSISVKFGENIKEVAGNVQKNVKRSIESMLGLKVNTVNVHPKAKRRGMSTGFTSSWKKAVVTLNPADSIAFFEGIA